MGTFASSVDGPAMALFISGAFLPWINWIVSLNGCRMLLFYYHMHLFHILLIINPALILFHIYWKLSCIS